MVIMYAVDFEYRSDGGPSLVGPFGTKAAGRRWVDKQNILDSRYEVRTIYIPEVP